MQQYGRFDDAHREYVITNPKTPAKWINYIGTLSFGGFVDHTGGALICKNDPSLNRITKYIPQLPNSEFKGETLYLRIKVDGAYTIFSPTFVPTLDDFDRYECHVGLGYTRIISEFYGLRTEITIFVPLNEAREVRDIRITNISDCALEVDAIPVVEYTHPDAVKQFTNADWVPQTMTSKLALDENGVKILTQYPFMFRDSKVNYLTSNLPAASFETDRARFLGDHEYGTWARPLALCEAELSNTQALRGDNIAALLHHLGALQPGETRRLITQLGQEENLAKALDGIHHFRDEAVVDAALALLESFWDRYLNTFQVQTPDAEMNSLLNVHHPHQCYITKQWSRYLSLYQLGLGSRGIGFRDSSQDVMAVIPFVPQEALGLMRQLLSTQKPDGSAMHQFNPLSMEASAGDSSEMEDRPHYYSDDHLWIILAVTAYLKETGDFAFLSEDLPYYVGAPGKSRRPMETGSVLNHLQRGLAFTRGDVGAHGLPLLGFADWNDTVNLRTGAESLFTAHLYGKALLEMIDLCRTLDDEPAAQAYTADYEEMKRRVNDCAWDGEWYLRYFDFDGAPLGSHTNDQGQIYLNGQTWAVISGFATPDRALQALESVYRQLNTTNGIKLSAPGFNGFDPTRGGITTYPPGAKENGGIFLHTNPWAIIAETLTGNGERAYQYYRQVSPAARNERIDEYEIEPYVYAQNILGDEHPQFGLGRNSWLSGTASWMYQAATQYILGIRPTYQGLKIEPCLPPAWDGFRVERTYRGARYIISVSNPQRVSYGVVAMLVDGQPVQGNVIPPFADNKEHSVEVVLGNS